MACFPLSRFRQARSCTHDTWSRPLDTVQACAVPRVVGITLRHAVNAASVVRISLPLWNSLLLYERGFSFRYYSTPVKCVSSGYVMLCGVLISQDRPDTYSPCTALWGRWCCGTEKWSKLWAGLQSWLTTHINKDLDRQFRSLCSFCMHYRFSEALSREH